jgi:hypothetical protein
MVASDFVFTIICTPKPPTWRYSGTTVSEEGGFRRSAVTLQYESLGCLPKLLETHVH